MKNGSSFHVNLPWLVSQNNSGHIPNTKMDMKKVSSIISKFVAYFVPFHRSLSESLK